MLKAMIFDMDGVLVDSEPLHVSAERQVCAERGINIPLSEWKNFQGKTDEDIFRHIISGFTDGTLHPNQLIGHKRRIFMAQAHTIKLISGAREFVEKARRNFARLGLATSSGRDYLEKVLVDVHDLGKFFDTIVTREDVRYGKPNPEPYILAAERLGVGPAECVVIEDSENGIHAAKTAGCFTIGIATSLPLAYLDSLEPDFAAYDFQEIAEFLAIR